jgi:hypothetical protein
MADTKQGNFQPWTEDVAGIYEINRTNKKAHPYDRMPGWAYWDAMQEYELPADNSKFSDPVARLTYITDNRPWLYDQDGDKGYIYRTPSSRAFVNAQRRALYSQAGYRNAVPVGAMIPGETDAIQKINLRNSLLSGDITESLRYNTGMTDANNYAAYLDRDIQGYTPSPIGHGTEADHNTRARAARNYSMLGHGLNTALDTPLYVAGFGLAGRGVQALSVANKASKAGRAVLPRLRALNRYNAMPRMAPKKGFSWGTSAALGAIGDGLYSVTHGLNSSNSYYGRSLDTGALRIIPDYLRAAVYELPVIGYQRGKNGPEPIKANYSDYYQYLRRRRGQQVADEFRTYHMNKAQDQAMDNRKALEEEYGKKYDAIITRTSGLNSRSRARDYDLRDLNKQYMDRFKASNEALAANDDAINAFNKGDRDQ